MNKYTFEYRKEFCIEVEAASEEDAVTFILAGHWDKVKLARGSHGLWLEFLELIEEEE